MGLTETTATETAVTSSPAFTAEDVARFHANGWWIDTTVSDAARANATRTPDRAAYLDHPDRSLTWREFDTAATALARQLAGAGVRPGSERVLYSRLLDRLGVRHGFTTRLCMRRRADLLERLAPARGAVLAEVSREQMQRYEMIGNGAAMQRVFHEVEKVEVSGPASTLLERLEAIDPDLVPPNRRCDTVKPEPWPLPSPPEKPAPFYVADDPAVAADNQNEPNATLNTQATHAPARHMSAINKNSLIGL